MNLQILRTFAIVVTLSITCLANSSHAETAVSEKAQRFFDRGTAAIKAAEKPEDFRDAAEEFNKASAAAPSWPDPYYNAGVALEKAGDPAGAYKAFKSYLKAAPTAPDAKQVKKKVNELEYLAEKKGKQKSAAGKSVAIDSLSGNWKVWSSGFKNRAPLTTDKWFDISSPAEVKATGDHISVTQYGTDNFTARFDGTVAGDKISGKVLYSYPTPPGFPRNCPTETYTAPFEGRIVDSKTLLLYLNHWRDEVTCSFQSSYMGYKLTR